LPDPSRSIAAFSFRSEWDSSYVHDGHMCNQKACVRPQLSVFST
jgi:hypothetical protein